MKKNLIFLMAFMSFGMFVKAIDPNPIFTAVPSLSITPDARAGGMGDVGAATSPDVYSQFWNPAKYVFLESQAGVSVSYTPWLRQLVSDIDLSYVSGYYKFDDRQAVSASLRYFSLGEIILTDYQGERLAEASPNELALDVAYSRMLSEFFSASVAMRFIYSDLSNGFSEGMTAGMSVAADVAGYYRRPISLSTGEGNLAFGLNISNLGSKISYEDGVNSSFIPTNMRLGGSFLYPIDDYQSISFSADLNKLLVPTPNASITNEFPNYYNDMSGLTGVFKSFSDAPAEEELREIMWSVGAEYAYNKQFFVRAGYFNENEYKGNRKYFTAGAGFKLNVFQIDAGYVISTAQTSPLDQTLRISVAFDLFGLRNLMK